MMTPIVPAAAEIAVANPASYPFSFMAGIIKEPIAETVAGPEPEIAAKNIQANTVTMAKPPVMKPTKLSARFTRRFDMPPCNIRAPAKIKNGIASESIRFTSACL